MTKNEMSSYGVKLRNQSDITDIYLKTLCKSGVFYKSMHWAYESEWRACIWNTDKNNQITNPNGKTYIEQKIPLSCIGSITIGAKADQKSVKQTLEEIKKKNHKYMQNIKIKESNILIR